jgi:hypothetical protein
VPHLSPRNDRRARLDPLCGDLDRPDDQRSRYDDSAVARRASPETAVLHAATSLQHQHRVDELDLNGATVQIL